MEQDLEAFCRRRVHDLLAMVRECSNPVLKAELLEMATVWQREADCAAEEKASARQSRRA